MFPPISLLVVLLLLSGNGGTTTTNAFVIKSLTIASTTRNSLSLIQRQQPSKIQQQISSSSYVSQRLFLSSNDGSVDSSSNGSGKILSYTLKKPMGLILTENNNSGNGGVMIESIDNGGSAAALLTKREQEQVSGSLLVSVQGMNVQTSTLENVLNAFGNAPNPVTIEILLSMKGQTEQEAVNTDTTEKKQYEIGTEVTIIVQSSTGSMDNKKKPNNDVIMIQAKVGDNLRQTLLDNNVEVYSGFKQKVSNCGGAGQCTFCAFDFITSDGWDERFDYENKKIAKFPNARLACLNNIQGPATISKTQR